MFNVLFRSSAAAAAATSSVPAAGRDQPGARLQGSNPGGHALFSLAVLPLLLRERVRVRERVRDISMRERVLCLICARNLSTNGALGDLS